MCESILRSPLLAFRFAFNSDKIWHGYLWIHNEGGTQNCLSWKVVYMYGRLKVLHTHTHTIVWWTYAAWIKRRDAGSTLIYDLDAIFVFQGSFCYKKYQKCNPSLKTDEYKLSKRPLIQFLKQKTRSCNMEDAKCIEIIHKYILHPYL